MNTTNQQGMIAKAQSNKVANQKDSTMKDTIYMFKGEFSRVLPKMIPADRFCRMLLTSTYQTPKLATCSKQSFITAALQSASLGLEPNTPLGQAYLIPYGNNVQFQIGYKGLINLFYRDPNAQMLDAQAVHENDEFEYEYGLNPTLKHKPALKNRGEVYAYYAMYKLKDGGFGFEVMSKEDIEGYAKKYSKTYRNGPWQTDFDAMAKKTVIKQMLKYAPMATEVMTGVNADESIKTVKVETAEEAINAPNEFFDVEYQEQPGEDPVTGEIKE